MLLFTLHHAALIAIFALIAFGAGSALLRLFLPGIACRQNMAMAIALGGALIAEAIFLLGTVGALTRSNVLIVLAIAGIVGAVDAARGLRAEGWRPLSLARGVIALRDDPWRVIVIAVIAAASVPAFFLALYPPVGFDATMYHLPFARLFAEAGALVFADALWFPIFPQLGEMLFTGALLVADDVTAQLTQWLALVVTAAAIAGLARELAGRAASVLAVALWAGSPLAIFVGANAYIDASLTMYITLAFAAWHGWRRDGRIGWAALAGVFAGCAAGTKYHGLFFVIVLLAAFARRNLRAVGCFALMAALFAVPWYVRIYRATGNPLFPYLSAIFGRNDWQTTLDRRLEAAIGWPGDKVPQPESVQPAVIPTPSEARRRDPLLASPASRPQKAPRESKPRTVFDRAVLERALKGSAPHNPWLVLLIPLAMVGAATDRSQRWPMGAALVYAMIVWSLDWRFLIAIVPLLSIAIAIGITNLSLPLTRRPPAALRYAAFALVAPGMIWSTQTLAEFGAIPVSAEQRHAFLAREIDLYDALHTLGTTRGRPVLYLLGAANPMYYCPGRCLGNSRGPYRNPLIIPLLAQPDRLAETLRGWGVDILVAERRVLAESRSRPDARFERVYRNVAAEAFVVPGTR